LQLISVRYILDVDFPQNEMTTPINPVTEKQIPTKPVMMKMYIIACSIGAAGVVLIAIIIFLVCKLIRKSYNW